jgi:hypothetical protein
MFGHPSAVTVTNFLASFIGCFITRRSLSLDFFRVWFTFTFPYLTINILLSSPVISFLPLLIMPLNWEYSHISPATELIISHYIPFFLHPDMATCTRCRLLNVSLYRVGIIHTLTLEILSIHHFHAITIDIVSLNKHHDWRLFKDTIWNS